MSQEHTFAPIKTPRNIPEEALFQYLQECINPGYPLGDLELEAKRAEESSC